MKGFVTARHNYSSKADIEHIETYWWDRDADFLRAIENSHFNQYYVFGQNPNADAEEIEFCKKFIKDFDPETMIVKFGEQKSGYGFQETFCMVYRIKAEAG